jgi:hypothetical protein
LSSGFEVIRSEFKHFNCILAKRVSKESYPIKYTNEVKKVEFSLIKHNIKYFVYLQLQRFGIEFFKNVKA